MAPYRILLWSPDDATHEERMIECAHADEAIDRTGWLDHPHAIDLWQEDRHVARFPPSLRPGPWTPGGRPRK